VDDETDKPEMGKSAVPIVGFDPTDGWIFGGAGFLYSDKMPGVNAGLFLVSNLGDFNSVTFNYEQRARGGWYLGLHIFAEQAYDYYYGEGDLTSPYNPLVLRQDHYEAKPAIRYLLRPHLSAGVFLDFRARRELGSQVKPNEATTALGFHLDWDTRNKLINTRKGQFFQLDFLGKPGADAFSQETADLRNFDRLNRVLTLASRLSAGITQDIPTYLFEYRLGGLDLMRGYQANRFRGDDFAVYQEELRWILKKWVSANMSVDAGDIGDDAFHQLKVSVQAGLRIGIPPDWTQKIRLDVGLGTDQAAFVIQFGEVF
jgi:outer membrane protein assembly factor BamA